ncbi:MAG: crotonase/enoyl-CoA hydratase family protein [Acidobacteriota bacterium]
MSSPIVTYSLDGPVATITMDDGQNNLVSPTMLSQLNAALDRAQRDQAIVVLTGRPDMFCAGFDLKILQSGVLDAFGMLTGGFELSARLLAFPTPVLIASTGHAVAMGSFLLLSGDYRVGALGDYKIMANEVAIGLTVPHSAVAICRQRLDPAHLVRAVTLSECFDPRSAVAAGFLDRAVEPQDLAAVAAERAAEYSKLDLDAHRKTKLRLRKQVLRSIGRGLARDRMEFVGLGIQRAVRSLRRR